MTRSQWQGWSRRLPSGQLPTGQELLTKKKIVETSKFVRSTNGRRNRRVVFTFDARVSNDTKISFLFLFRKRSQTCSRRFASISCHTGTICGSRSRIRHQVRKVKTNGELTNQLAQHSPWPSSISFIGGIAKQGCSKEGKVS